jgi:isopentenyl-diphosphate delta-isomerase
MIQITDNQSEVFDIVDEQDHVVGTALRRQVHTNKSLIHRSIAIAVFNKKGEILMQQRSETKDTNPLQWTVSCSGHVGTGDTYEDAARRELEEELGIIVPLTQVKKYLVGYTAETEMTMLYKAFYDGPFSFNVVEIKQIQFFSSVILRNIIQSNSIEISLSGRLALQHLRII